MRRPFLAVLLALLLAPAASAEQSGSALVGYLNAQREAHGFPAGIVEDPALSDGCAKHNNYMALNGGLTHDETVGAPGYTPEGEQAGGTSVLYQGSVWAAGANPFETAPIHLQQLLAPRIDRMGAFESEGFGCATTLASRNRSAPATDVTYTYPRDGATDWRPSETAAEDPFTPGEKLGIPEGTATGPYLYLLFDGPDLTVFDTAQVTSASLTGPAGPVEIAVADNTTPEVGAYLPTGAQLIPRRPLVPRQTYTASVSATVAGRPFSHTWSFTTGALENRLFLTGLTRASDGSVAIRVSSDAPGGTVTFTGPGRAATVPIVDSVARTRLDRNGTWTACARTGGAGTDYKPAEACDSFVVEGAQNGPPPGPATLTPGKPYAVSLTRKGRLVTVTVRASRAVRFRGVLSGGGQRVRLTSRKVGAGRWITTSWKFKRGVQRVKLRGVVSYDGKRRVVKKRLRL